VESETDFLRAPQAASYQVLMGATGESICGMYLLGFVEFFMFNP